MSAFNYVLMLIILLFGLFCDYLIFEDLDQNNRHEFYKKIFPFSFFRLFYFYYNFKCPEDNTAQTGGGYSCGSNALGLPVPVLSAVSGWRI